MAQPPIAPPPGFNGPPGLDRPQDLDLKTIQQLGTKILAKSNEVTPSDNEKNNNATVVSEDGSEKKEKSENASKSPNDRGNNKRRGRGNNQPRNQSDRQPNNAHSNSDEPKSHQRNQARGRGQQHSQRAEHNPAQRGRGSNSGQSAAGPAAGKKLKNISDFNARPSAEDSKVAEKKKDEPRAEVATKTSGEVLADDGDAVYCLTCCEPVAYFALGPCNHRDLCDKCSLRMRECYKDNSCPLCKNAIDQVIYTRDEHKKYEEYEVKQMWYDELLKAYFEDETHYTKTLTLWDFVCPVCRDAKSKFNGLFALQKHIKTAHQLYYCDVCLKYRKVFLHEQKLYNKTDLPKHKREGDAELQLKPHSWCEYCKQYLFGEDELFYHCQDKHETCFLCEAKGVRWQYFRNYDHLERHFDARHQLCHDEQCLARKFVVFDSPIELQAHRISAHGKQMSKHELLQAKTLQVNWNASSNTNQSAPSSEEGYVMHLKFDVGGTVAQSPNAIKSALASNESPNNTNSGGNSTNRNNGAVGLSRDEITKRNKAVISAMKAYLGNEAKFTQFRNVSAQFRQRQLSTEQYWQEFIAIFGKDPTGLDLFEALTELLPDTEADLRATLLTLVAAARLEQGPARVDSRQFPSLAGSARDAQPVSLSANYSTLLRPSAPPSREEFPALAPSRASSSSGGTRGPALHQHQYFQQHPSLLPNFYAPRNSDAQQGANTAASTVANNNAAQVAQGPQQGGKKKKKQVQVLSWG